LEFQLDFETLVINRLVETAAFVLIDFKAGANNGVALILSVPLFLLFVSFRVFRRLKKVQQLNFRSGLWCHA